ncbi:potassium channel family protein [Pseudorhodobacter sp. MZDSW-24AT]|uniref:potassium channel family protein n=1 Tax=Pseudorhodobacter sp. MZDSW-24AT TaxID=2052957 RepID=UPI000C1F8276|nr:potassium channel family protein [Pseudorhodobacter sp. MZDSW-24AT]PJF10114.1 metal transporter [Pseudorhodobacter sp. MZDSW-24AT]
MLIQITLGTALLLASIAVAAVSALGLERAYDRLSPWLLTEPHQPKLVALLCAVSLWVLFILTVSVWIWALAFHGIGAFASLEESLYFALVSFTTLGFGDVILPQEWRLLSGMIAANGFLNFGLMTALMVEALRHVRLGQHERRRARRP